MYEIVTQLLWVGNERDAQDVKSVLKLGAAAVIDLAMEESPIPFPRDVAYCRLPLVDGPGNPPEMIRAVVDLTASLIRSRVPTFVACGGGMSRSPAVAAAALALVREQSADEMLKEVTAGVAHDVAPAFWNEVKEACGL